jgi:hypothetical protein
VEWLVVFLVFDVEMASPVRRELSKMPPLQSALIQLQDAA